MVASTLPFFRVQVGASKSLQRHYDVTKVMFLFEVTKFKIKIRIKNSHIVETLGMRGFKFGDSVHRAS